MPIFLLSFFWILVSCFLLSFVDIHCRLTSRPSVLLYPRLTNGDDSLCSSCCSLLIAIIVRSSPSYLLSLLIFSSQAISLLFLFSFIFLFIFLVVAGQWKCRNNRKTKRKDKNLTNFAYLPGSFFFHDNNKNGENLLWDFFFSNFLFPFFSQLFFFPFDFYWKKSKKILASNDHYSLKRARMIHSGLGPYKRENTITCIAIGLALPTTAGHIIWLSHLYQSDLFAYIYSTVLFLFSFTCAWISFCCSSLPMLSVVSDVGSLIRQTIGLPWGVVWDQQQKKEHTRSIKVRILENGWKEKENKIKTCCRYSSSLTSRPRSCWMDVWPPPFTWGEGAGKATRKLDPLTVIEKEKLRNSELL